MNSQIDHLLSETRRFPPSEEFAAQAVLSPELNKWPAADREGFWAEQSRELMHWDTPFTHVLDWSTPPFPKWFDDSELNVSCNYLYRHVEAVNGERVALDLEGEPGDSRRITYAELTEEVKRVATVIEDLGIDQGYRVEIYLPMIPEAIASMLAVA